MIYAAKQAIRVPSIIGTLSDTSLGNPFPTTPESRIYFSAGKLFGLTSFCIIIPYMNAPRPSPDTIIPLTMPFLPGKCDQVALSGAG